MREMGYPGIPNWQLDRWFTSNDLIARQARARLKAGIENNDLSLADKEFLAAVDRIAREERGKCLAELEYRRATGSRL